MMMIFNTMHMGENEVFSWEVKVLPIRQLRQSLRCILFVPYIVLSNISRYITQVIIHHLCLHSGDGQQKAEKTSRIS